MAVRHPWFWCVTASARGLFIRGHMTTNDLRNAVRFLEKVFVGRVDEDLLVTTIKNINNEIRKREKDERRTR